MRVGVFVWGAALVFAVETAQLYGGFDEQEERIARLIKQLGHDEFAKREAASEELEAIGAPALPALRKAAASGPDAETRSRAEQIAQAIAGRLLAVTARKEIERLQGTWYSISTETNGVRES